MEQLWSLFVDHFYKFIVTGFFTIITLMLRSAFNYYKKSVEIRQQALNCERAEQELLKQGMLSLLRFRVHRLCTHISTQGFMTIDEKNDLVDLYESYKSLGGNSRTQIMYENVIEHFDIKMVNAATPSDVFRGDI